MGQPSPLEPGQPNNTQTQTSVSPLLPQHTHSRHTQSHIWRVSRCRPPLPSAVARVASPTAVAGVWLSPALSEAVIHCLRSPPMAMVRNGDDKKQRRQLGLAPPPRHLPSPSLSSPLRVATRHRPQCPPISPAAGDSGRLSGVVDRGIDPQS